MQKTLLIDGSDLFKRIKAEIALENPPEFKDGEWRLYIPGQMKYPKTNFISKFANAINAYIKKFEPNEAYVLLDGMAYGRKNNFELYKVNKQLSKNDYAKIEEAGLAWQAQEESLEFLRKCYPVPTVMSQDWEAIDMAYYIQQEQKEQLAETGECDELIYVTTNLDAHMLEMKSYNPVTNSYFEKLPYDYLMYKSVVGDSENGVDGIDSHQKAVEVSSSKKTFEQFLSWQSESAQKIVERNLKLFSPLCGESSIKGVKLILKGSRTVDIGALFMDINCLSLELEDDYLSIGEFVKPLCKREKLLIGNLL